MREELKPSIKFPAPRLFRLPGQSLCGLRVDAQVSRLSHKVRQMFIFGSVLTKSYKKNSDIDFIVDFQGVDLYDYADNYFDLKNSLEHLFQREVDLLEDKAIKNPFLSQSIDSSKRLIYG